jgi:hypothetical protein
MPISAWKLCRRHAEQRQQVFSRVFGVAVEAREGPAGLPWLPRYASPDHFAVLLDDIGPVPGPARKENVA